MTDKKYGGKIEQWYVIQHGDVSLVWGNLYNDPGRRFGEGAFIHTSKVVKLDIENKKVETLNTIYDLGNESEESKVIQKLKTDQVLY
jgi:hypothetical protein